MKFGKVIAAGLAAAAISAFSLTAGAFELNKDLGIGWSQSITVPAEEFEGADENSVFTLTYTADTSIDDYWCVKPMINDAGWPFINDLIGPALSDGGDSYPVATDETEIKFTIPADTLEHLQEAGMAFMGHGITLGELTFSNDETLSAAAAEEAPAEEAPVEEADVQPAVEEAPAVTTTATTTSNPATGVSLSLGTAVASFVGIVALKKKKQ